ncbi:hypothetical protein DFH08DRAFT_799664 [Mycena albidolilacea]|uniref:Uncharacterized protein n=1 Tax=Mycena albidolilacea TaxID=1033008 RepID=A0AAD7F396_9AGAR|nr:hypothetical protein DFH08DRAFT_799664 [Mycena albidolilacea]
MPRLTHLSFDDITLQDASYRNALRDCKSLEVLAASWSNVNLIEAFVREGRYATIATDLRFVVLLATHRILDWETGARGGADYWVRADELVRKRRSGETNVTIVPPLVIQTLSVVQNVGTKPDLSWKQIQDEVLLDGGLGSQFIHRPHHGREGRLVRTATGCSLSNRYVTIISSAFALLASRRWPTKTSTPSTRTLPKLIQRHLRSPRDLHTARLRANGVRLKRARNISAPYHVRLVGIHELWRRVNLNEDGATRGIARRLLEVYARRGLIFSHLCRTERGLTATSNVPLPSTGAEHELFANTNHPLLILYREALSLLVLELPSTTKRMLETPEDADNGKGLKKYQVAPERSSHNIRTTREPCVARVRVADGSGKRGTTRESALVQRHPRDGARRRIAKSAYVHRSHRNRHTERRGAALALRTRNHIVHGSSGHQGPPRISGACTPRALRRALRANSRHDSARVAETTTPPTRSVPLTRLTRIESAVGFVRWCSAEASARLCAAQARAQCGPHKPTRRSAQRAYRASVCTTRPPTRGFDLARAACLSASCIVQGVCSPAAALSRDVWWSRDSAYDIGAALSALTGHRSAVRLGRTRLRDVTGSRPGGRVETRAVIKDGVGRRGERETRRGIVYDEASGGARDFFTS